MAPDGDEPPGWLSSRDPLLRFRIQYTLHEAAMTSRRIFDVQGCKEMEIKFARRHCEFPQSRPTPGPPGRVRPECSNSVNHGTGSQLAKRPLEASPAAVFCSELQGSELLHMRLRRCFSNTRGHLPVTCLQFPPGRRLHSDRANPARQGVEDILCEQSLSPYVRRPSVQN